MLGLHKEGKIMNKAKQLWRQFWSSRTNWLQVSVVALGAFQVYVFQFELSAETVFALTTLFGVANIFLRYQTNTAMSQK